MLSFMRDESLRTGSLSFADDADDAGDAEYAASDEQQEPAYAALLTRWERRQERRPGACFVATWEAEIKSDKRLR